MSKRIRAAAVCAVALLATLAVLTARRVRAQESGDQFYFKAIGAGVLYHGNGVLQVGLLNSLSAAVATNTTTQVVAGPAAGSLYLRGIWVEKMTTSTGLVNAVTGTGVNCGTGTATLFSYSLAASQAPQWGEFNINVRLPAGNALCLQTDGSTTSVRALYN